MYGHCKINDTCFYTMVCLILVNAKNDFSVLIDFLLTLKAATLIFISGRGLSISFAKEGKSGPKAKR